MLNTRASRHRPRHRGGATAAQPHPPSQRRALPL